MKKLTLKLITLSALGLSTTLAHADPLSLALAQQGTSVNLGSCGGIAQLVKRSRKHYQLQISDVRECSRLTVDGQTTPMTNESGTSQGPFSATVQISANTSDVQIELSSRSGIHSDSLIVSTRLEAGVCHADLSGLYGSVVAGQTNISIDFQVRLVDGSYYATPVNVSLKNQNIPEGESVQVHWINGAYTAQVIDLNYSYSAGTFTGQLTHTDSSLGQRIGSEYDSSATAPSQIAVEIGNGWLDDSYDHADRHNFNFDLAKAFQAQGGQESECFLGAN